MSGRGRVQDQAAGVTDIGQVREQWHVWTRLIPAS
jgi:hypothetical protein